MRLTLTLDPVLEMEGWEETVADVAGMLDAVDEHDEWTLSANEDGSESIIMLADDERTVWYVVTMPSLGTQIDTFTLSDDAKEA